MGRGGVNLNLPQFDGHFKKYIIEVKGVSSENKSMVCLIKKKSCMQDVVMNGTGKNEEPGKISLNFDALCNA